MAEKMAERIAEILKEPNFQTAEKALTDFCGPMDGEFRNLLVDIIVERWIDTPKDVPFSYARSIWNRKDINREEYQALLEEIRSYPIAPINKAKISDFLWVVENDFSNAKIILDFMKKMSLGNDTPNKDLFDNFRVETKNQKYMEYYTDGLNTAIESIIGKKEEKGISTLFSRGGTNISTNNAPKQEFELISYMVVK